MTLAFIIPNHRSSLIDRRKNTGEIDYIIVLHSTPPPSNHQRQSGKHDARPCSGKFKRFGSCCVVDEYSHFFTFYHLVSSCPSLPFELHTFLSDDRDILRISLPDPCHQMLPTDESFYNPCTT
mmetsp:Transcript_2321/g.4310  ORF Transcript_2321/g.4310 Transcript_2321/m.4310 type:complete len:123 (+) Transcript_2321:903-1271(+)